MEQLCKEQVIKLFNEGVLTDVSAEWYTKQGFYLVCNDGKVVDIVREGD